jgi:hypothetical protein
MTRAGSSALARGTERVRRIPAMSPPPCGASERRKTRERGVPGRPCGHQDGLKAATVGRRSNSSRSVRSQRVGGRKRAGFPMAKGAPDEASYLSMRGIRRRGCLGGHRGRDDDECRGGEDHSSVHRSVFLFVDPCDQLRGTRRGPSPRTAPGARRDGRRRGAMRPTGAAPGRGAASSPILGLSGTDRDTPKAGSHPPALQGGCRWPDR